MNKDRFTLIEGGLSQNSISDCGKRLELCHITNTRLMGVLAMYMRFELEDMPYSCIHQFFYFDAEEFGFESYKSVKGNDMHRVYEIGGGMMGGLGGEPVNLNLKEAVHLLQHFVDFNRMRHLPMPEGISEYGFLLNLDGELSEPDRYILNAKICVRPRNDYEAVNYFLMRCFGKDFDGASMVAVPGVELELFPDYRAGTFCKNVIDEGDEDGTYICESLVEFDNRYHLTVTKVSVAGRRVTRYERINTLTVSAMEAAMMLSRSEYVNVYALSPEVHADAGRSLSKLTEGAMITDYPGGKLFMIFHANNDHVAKKEYRLNEDVLGLYYVSGRQLICASYSKEDMWELEKDLAKCSIRNGLKPISRYEFLEPVVYEFINSGFDSFDEFVAIISQSEE